jgi:hypothetical protein
MVWTLTVYTPDGNTALGTLSEAHSVRVNARASRMSSALTFTVDLESTDDIALLQSRRVVKVTDNGTDLGAYFVHGKPTLLLEPGELPGVSYQCLSLESWLGGSRVGGAVVYPFGGLSSTLRKTEVLEQYDPRRFGWHQRDYDDSDWIPAYSRGTQGNPDPSVESWVTWETDFPDPDAHWLWTRPKVDVTGSGGNDDPRGTVYFRGWWDPNLPGGTNVRIYVTAISNWTLWVNGVQGARHRKRLRGDWRRAYVFDIEVGSAEVLFALDATVGGRPDDVRPEFDSVGGFLMTVVTLDEFDQPDEVVFRTSPANFVCLDYPETVPGVTIGFILERLIDEAQDRGALAGMSYGFDDEVDSDGTPWPNELTHGWRLGSTLGWVAEQLTEFGCDFQVDSDGELRVVVQAGTDLSQSVTLDRLEQATLSGDGVQGNAALVVTPGGVDERLQDTSVGIYGRVEIGSAFGTSDEPRTVEDPVAELLSKTSWPRDDGQLSLSEESPQPFADFGLSDWVSFPSRAGGVQVGRVVEVDGTQNDGDGTVDWTVTLDAVDPATNPTPSTVTENV